MGDQDSGGAAMFNVARLSEVSCRAIRAFAQKHSGERFYACAIDGAQISLNTVEHFEAAMLQQATAWRRRHEAINLGDYTRTELFGLMQKLEVNKRTHSAYPHDLEQWLLEQNAYRAEQRQRGNPFMVDAETLAEFRLLPEYWAYQGVVDLNLPNAFSLAGYHHYCEMDDQARQRSAYQLAMNALCEQLREQNPFEQLVLTDDFQLFVVSSQL